MPKPGSVQTARSRACRKSPLLIAKRLAIRREPLRDPTKIEELTNQVAWSTRIFEDRRKSIRYACEVPVIIEKRLFALSRAIAQTIEQ